MTTYKITLLNDLKGINTTFECDENQSILEAAENNGIELSYSCRAGSCSTCLGKVIKGQIDQNDQSFLSEEQMNDGFALTCVSYPKSDVTLLTHQEEALY